MENMYKWRIMWDFLWFYIVCLFHKSPSKYLHQPGFSTIFIYLRNESTAARPRFLEEVKDNDSFCISLSWAMEGDAALVLGALSAGQGRIMESWDVRNIEKPWV